MIDKNIAFCIVDDICTYANVEIQTTIKNICDFTISNLYAKGYNVLVDKDEDALLKKVKQYDYAVVMSPGTEYTHGSSFFDELNNLIKEDFFIAGHILDRSEYDAYYELHHQCYVINMSYYNLLQCPRVGFLEKNVQHTQIAPGRSTDNWHDDYTPKFVCKGTTKRTYNNKCHGWNFLQLAFENNLSILVFNEKIRNSKRHYYPEIEKDYYKHKEYIDYKFKYCKEEFIHTNNTESKTEIIGLFEQVVVPASGMMYLDLIEKGRVVFYDYNLPALEYWKEHCIRKKDIDYIFVYTDLLNNIDIIDYLNPDLKTLINLSNVFCYEGTVSQYSLEHRLTAQNNLVTAINNKVKDVKINFTLKANEGH